MGQGKDARFVKPPAHIRAGLPGNDYIISYCAPSLRPCLLAGRHRAGLAGHDPVPKIFFKVRGG
jgi:hypothetical protein